jgi:DNA-binding transcriptional regulator YiaG
VQYCMQYCDTMKLQRKTGARKSASGRLLKKSGRAKMATARASANGIAFAHTANSEVRRLSRTYRLSNEALSRVTGASPRTVAYWNAGTPP